MKPESLPAAALREVALSLQIYQQGRALLQQAVISTDQLHIHALIIAQIALEDGSLFPLLHQQLLSQNSPGAWTFLHMDQTEVEYWQ